MLDLELRWPRFAIPLGGRQWASLKIRRVWHGFCQEKSEADQECNRFAAPYDGREVYNTYIDHWRLAMGS